MDNDLLPKVTAYLCHHSHTPLPVAHFHILWRRDFISDGGVVFGYADMFSVSELCWN
jgi:hypothetical protein